MPLFLVTPTSLRKSQHLAQPVNSTFLPKAKLLFQSPERELAMGRLGCAPLLSNRLSLNQCVADSTI
jgi:hypothetical protein